MNILIVNHYAGSHELGMEYRPVYFAREWIKDGHNVRIVAASFSHVRTNQPKVKYAYNREDISGIEYVWLKTPKYKGNGIGRIINMLTFVLRLLFNAKRIAENFSPDVVIASSTYPLDIFPARKITKLSTAKLIFEVHDLWPLSPVELGNMSRWNPLIIAMQFAENFAYRVSDKVVSILPCAKDHMVSHGLDNNKFYHIPNGIDLEEWKDAKELPGEHKETISDLKSNNKKMVCYAGSHGIANALDSFIKAAELFRDNSELVFVLVGDGPEKNKLIQLSENMNLKNVMFLPPVPKSTIPNLLSMMDILFISLKKQPLFRFGISPNKLIDYLMASKPIIQAIESGNDIVTDAKCGYTVEPENPQAIVNALSQLISLSNEKLDEMGQNGREYVEANHDYRVLASNFISAINSIHDIKKIYKKRGKLDIYNYSKKDVYLREVLVNREYLRILSKKNVTNSKLLEIGSGYGTNLSYFHLFGFAPSNIYGIDIIKDRVDKLLANYPGFSVTTGDAQQLKYSNGYFDVVLQSTVFSSILSPESRKKVAQEMLRVCSEDGLIIWYDFFMNNPKNKDVRGITKREIRSLFPGCSFRFKRVTLAPPIARGISNLGWLPSIILENLKAMNTHYIVEIKKK